jgi:hypothetical protein
MFFEFPGLVAVGLFAEDADFGGVSFGSVDVNGEVFEVVDEILEIFGLDLRKGERHAVLVERVVQLLMGLSGDEAGQAHAGTDAGTKGKRYSLPNSRIMIHQPSMEGLAGQAADIDIYAKEILRMRETLNQILAEYTGQGVERIAQDVDRDYIMSAEQAVEYGMIDRVVSSRELAPQPIARRLPDSRLPEDGAG